MMFFFFFFFLPLLLSLPIFIYLYITNKSKQLQPTASKNSANEKLPLPPGITGWPLIGETIDYILKLKNGVPQDFVTERMKKYSSKVFKTSLIGQPMAILHGAEGKKFLFCNERKLVQVWFPPFIDKLFIRSDSLSNNSYREMTEIRKKYAPFLKGESLQKLVGKMDSAMRDHLQTSWDREEITVSIEVRKYTLKLALLLFLGVDDPKTLEELSLLFEDLRAGLSSLPVNLPGTTYRRAIRASKKIIERIKDMIKQRKIDILEHVVPSTQDVLCHILITKGDQNGQLVEEFDIAATIEGLIFGSYDSLSTTLTFIIKYLAEVPHVYLEVLREQMEIAKSKGPETLLNWDDLRKMRYSWNAACEVLRLQPAGFGTFREAIADFTYAGCTIPKGWKLHWIANMTNKDPEYFPDPDKFDPSRFDGNGPTPYAFTPFGGGSRMCPGNEYARAAILVFMHNVVTKFKWEKVIPNEEVMKGPIPKCQQGLPIRLYPLKP